MAALERIFHLLDMEPSPAPISTPSPVPPPFTTIEFRDVWFAYQQDEHVLKGFNLVIRRGEKVALVGETGGGKTTVTRLLSRLYEVNRGAIAIDGTDIRELPLRELRRRIGVVLQDPYLFTGTVEYNISLGDEQARERVEQAARIVGAEPRPVVAKAPAAAGEKTK